MIKGFDGKPEEYAEWLEEKVKGLRKRVRSLQSQLDQSNRHISRRLRLESDYLSYEDDRRE